VIDTTTMLRLVFGAAGASAYLVLALVVVRAEGARAVRAALFAAAALSALGLVMDSPAGETLRRTAPAFDLSLRILAAGVPGTLWLALTALFRDRRVSRSHALLSLAPMAAAAPAYLLGGGPARVFFWIWSAASVALVVHAIVVVVRTGRGDLVESRRRLRRWLGGVSIFGCAVLLALLLTVAADALRLAGPLWWPTTLRALMAAAAIAAVAIVLDPRRQLLPAEPRPSPAPGSHDELLRALDAAMTTDQAWRQEGLTLAGLAARLGTPEYRLRLAINGQLGHRNFTQYVNGFRVEAAKALLTDPQSRPNVAQVAYAVGFSSLAPFNRTFKEITGVTPTQWRRERLIES
jgi:AraC-like DNA-binding protein